MQHALPKEDPAAKPTVGVIGAGTMGSGIAQLAAVHGHPVILFDTHHDQLARAKSSIEKSLRRDLERGKITEAALTGALDRVSTVNSLGSFGPCALVIEAIIEDLELKQKTFIGLETVVDPDCILATNTSSLSVTSIAGALKKPERVLGIHFFNPAPVMPLVEIVPGLGTDPNLASEAREFISDWGKTTVLAKDTPGFIVNRIARPFYGEALRILEESVADSATIDYAMREVGGFRMGPFELMDLIGNDVNYKVTESVFAAFYYDPRFRPSLTQKRMVEAGFLGRKSGRGYYDYRDGAPAPEPNQDKALGQKIFERILSMLINEAADALFLKIASAEEIDLAMTKGVNYPKGLLRWADELGPKKVLSNLEELQRTYGEDRYRPNPLLRTVVEQGKKFYE